MILNKKGISIPIAIFVLGVIAIFSLVVFSFHFSDREIEESFVGIGLIETVNSLAEEVAFHRERGLRRYSGEESFVLKRPGVVGLPGEVRIDVEQDRIVGKWYSKSSGKEMAQVVYFIP